MGESCPVCGNNNLKILEYNNYHYNYLIRKDKNLFEDKKILSCFSCGFSYCFPFVDTGKLSDFYENEYSSEDGVHYEPYDVGIYRWGKYYSTRSISQLMLLAQYVDLYEIEKLLDIGCGWGDTFSTLNNMGMKDNLGKYYALEGGKNYKNRLDELGVSLIDWNSDVLEIGENYNNFFDVVFMSHVLEHFNAEHLRDVLSNIYRYLRDGGRLFLEVPNDCANYQLLENENQVPHLSFFSKESLCRLLLDVGFHVEFAGEVGGIKETAKQYTHPIRSEFRKRVKKIIYKYSLIKRLLNVIQYFFKYHIPSIKKYYFSDSLTDIISSKNFKYGKNRASIRICATKRTT